MQPRVLKRARYVLPNPWSDFYSVLFFFVGGSTLRQGSTTAIVVNDRNDFSAKLVD
jgi:hypothetical protein